MQAAASGAAWAAGGETDFDYDNEPAWSIRSTASKVGPAHPRRSRLGFAGRHAAVVQDSTPRLHVGSGCGAHCGGPVVGVWTVTTPVVPSTVTCCPVCSRLDTTVRACRRR